MALRLQHLRKIRQLTQEQLADLIDCSHATISRWETGERLPDAEDILKLAKALKVHPGEIFAPLPKEADLTDAENRAVSLARQMTPKTRSTWFQVGGSLAQSVQTPKSPGRAAPR